MPGPHVVVAGAARSGTSLLAAQLTAHPLIDGGAVKETNFYSRHYAEGYDWYDGYFESGSDALRLDASVSYTYPQFPEALDRLAADRPRLVVYIAREPLARAASHYLLYRYYFKREPAATFGAALRADPYYAEVSDYERWLSALAERFPPDRLLIVPFPVVTDSAYATAGVVCELLDLDPPPEAPRDVMAHRNNVVAFRNDFVRRATRSLRHSAWYPRVRRALGAHAMKRIRAVATRTPEMPSLEQSLASCDDEQLAWLHDLAERADVAVVDALREQDERLRLGWAEHWQHTSRNT